MRVNDWLNSEHVADSARELLDRKFVFSASDWPRSVGASRKFSVSNLLAEHMQMRKTKRSLFSVLKSADDMAFKQKKEYRDSNIHLTRMFARQKVTRPAKSKHY